MKDIYRKICIGQVWKLGLKVYFIHNIDYARGEVKLTLLNTTAKDKYYDVWVWARLQYFIDDFIDGTSRTKWQLLSDV